MKIILNYKKGKFYLRKWSLVLEEILALLESFSGIGRSIKGILAFNLSELVKN